jgi:hypothetical protein
MVTGERTARALGYFSLGLGATQLAAPRVVARVAGVQPGLLSEATIRFVGVRELAAAYGILSQRRPAQWLWARAAGDMMDIAATTLALFAGNNDRRRVAATLAFLAAVAALDLQTGEELSGVANADGHIVDAITIDRPIEDVREFWKTFAPRAETAEYLQNSRFQPAPFGRGTEVRVELPRPRGMDALTAAVARFTNRNPHQQIQADLRRAKQLMEAGEITVSDATLQGANLMQHSAQASPHATEPGWKSASSQPFPRSDQA